MFIQTTNYLYKYENYKYSFIDLGYNKITYNSRTKEQTNDSYDSISNTILSSSKP